MNNIILGIFGVIFLIYSSAVINVQSQNVTIDLCNSKMSCRDCIQIQNCAWCLESNYSHPRCYNEQKTECKNFWYPVNSGEITEQLPTTQKKSSDPLEKIVQISPQRVSIKLRINEVYKMIFNYSQAEDYPVDLYFLMDLSSSMEDDKDKLSLLGDLLADTMNNITTNFRLGFGSFVDKVLMPFTSTVPEKLLKPCDNCVPPFGFRNNMPLSNDTEKFAIEVKNANVSGNIDAPEGGFDALMQAIVCHDEIGWRKQARRLVVFATDASFHHAGDGKLAGIITPNDGLCHLKDDYYTHSSEQDYPSISHINLKAKENAVNVIFAVVTSQRRTYVKLSTLIEGSSSAVLSEDSSNIVDVVRDEYNKISSSVEMKDDSPSYINVTYFSKCLGNELSKTQKCDGLKVGSTVIFDIEILATSCPADPKEWKQSFDIYTVGIKESLTVDLELLCSCPCEQNGKKNAEECKNHGTLLCGNCKCDQYFYGRTCECSKNDPGKIHQCRADNTTEIDCSGRGSCVCGQCECTTRDNSDEIISGDLCECDNYSCERENGLLCSGQGKCECGSCKCQPGWSGPACQCPTTKDTCIAPNALNKEICSGHGSCACGKCECDIKDDVRYTGKYCEKCPTCPGRCNELKDCVECQMYKKGLLKNGDDCANNCTLFKSVGVDAMNNTEDEHLCTFYDPDDCRYQFVYSEIVEKNGTVRAQKDPECTIEVNLYSIVIGVVGAIVLIGLAMLLLWKLLTSIHDRREFTRFEKEKLLASWEQGDNPLYKEATSTFKNPTFDN